ncbi:MAG TPA: AAA family ATPase [Ramlibacter sp.]|jgi:general secretion pathway protein A|uniref:AAA family ATPase n=1 Tax=Ramlibacter sp. TaxID=1917967 RepID=UPI002D66545E|nr:AAA family ATPase [Ramlibacter sp.]HZY19329.1 AAA family ATPase [Ramlibacter sp.]
MYAPYFGLSQEPFSIAPDPRYLFMSERHREALAHLLYGLGAGGGFVLLTGEIGTGKTTVCRCFLDQIPDSCNVAYIFNPKLTATELLQSVCDEFRIAVPPHEGGPRTVKDYLDPLNAFLLDAHARGRNSVLIIDEAQNLSEDVLEQLRLLTNLETNERKLLQIILIGQPELRSVLARPGLEQLAQRVIARYHLDALSRQETGQYVRHRLEVAGLARALPFERRALDRVHRLTRGVPRRINLLCDRALLGAFARSEAAVTPRIIDQAAREVFPRPATSAGARPAARPAFMLALGVVAGGALVQAGNRWLDARPGPSPRVAAASGSASMVPGPRAPVVASPGSPAASSATTAIASAASAAAARSAPPAASAASAAPPPAAASSAVAAASAAGAASMPASPVSAASALPAATAPLASSSAPATLLRDERQAWRELARAWKVEVGPGEPCKALAQESLQCFSRILSLSLIRQLDRPGIVTLDRERGTPSYALLVSLGDKSATLESGGSRQTVTLAALASRWNGEWSSLWRAPPGLDRQAPERETPELVRWVGEQLGPVPAASPDAPRPPALAVRIRNFQLSQGLPVDGLLGPLTFMQLNRTAGVDEPRLRASP